VSTEPCRKFFLALRWLDQKHKPTEVALLEQARALTVHVKAVGFHSSRSCEYDYDGAFD
jgi:hypothetical protein